MAATLSSSLADERFASLVEWAYTFMVVLTSECPRSSCTSFGAAPLSLFYYVGRKFLIWYKEQIADNISLWTAFVTLAVSIFLGSEIRSFLPVNLILLNVVVHLIYCGVKAYIRGCRKN